VTTGRARRRRHGPALLLACALSGLAGCDSPGATAGGISGVAAGTLSSNPAVGYAIGLTVRALVDTALSAAFRSLRQDEQDRIAVTAAALAPGEVARWSVDHGLPFGYRNAAGRLQVTRVIDTPLAQCREVFFTLEGEDKTDATPRFFTATTCHQAEGWKWATAEPAVERWGSLQ
jgi:hypothetical protein